MNQIIKNHYLYLWAAFFALLIGVVPAHSASVNLEAFVSFAINDSAGDPLADGSIIQIIGSQDADRAGFGSLGGNLISNIAIDDEIIIGTVEIDSTDPGSNGAGTFYSFGFSFDIDTYTHVYLRAFDSVNPLEGLLNWSFSDIFAAPDNLAFSTVDFAPDSSFNTSNQDNFATVPEPGTGTLLIVCTGLLFWLRFSLRRPKKKVVEEEGSVKEEPVKEDWL